MPEFNFKSDLVVHLNDEATGERILVAMDRGGENFPWAEHNGEVITGPLRPGVLLKDGTDAKNLKWRVDDYWVVEAINSNGDPVDLTPQQYERAVTAPGHK